MPPSGRSRGLRRTGDFCMRKLLTFITVLIALAFASCNRFADVSELEHTLGLSLNDYKIEKLHMEKRLWSPDYVRPYNLYISFETSERDAIRLFNTLGLQKYDESKLAMQYGEDSIFCFFVTGGVKSFWSIVPTDTIDYSYKEAKSIKWWLPDTRDTDYLYAFYYSAATETKSAKVVPCKDGPYGKIVAQYVPEQRKVYILIRD